MKKRIRWGILGLGKIAHQFAHDLQLSETAVVHAVASRSHEKATDFAKTYNAKHWYDSYETMLQNKDIDIVYIATPHTFHFEHTMLCLQYRKAVLCEKPMGIHLTEVQQMLQTAKDKQVFLMEAVWTRFMPAIEKVLEIIHAKTIGEITHLRADFGFRTEFNAESRLYNKKLGGGTLLDIGIYPIFLSLLILGIPKEIKAFARMTSTEVDAFCGMLFHYENNAKAVLESSFEADTPTEAYIYGTKGHLKIHRRFHQPNSITVYANGKETEIEIPYTGNGYLHEIEEVHDCLLNDRKESLKLPLSVSEHLIRIIDRVKSEIGLSYISE